MIVAVIGGVAVLGVLVAFVASAAGRNRRPTDNIASFRRQIDALSPEARRQTSDRMKPTERSVSGDDGVDDT